MVHHLAIIQFKELPQTSDCGSSLKLKDGQTYYITLHHRLLWGMNLESIAAIYEHAVFCITVYAHTARTDILHKNDSSTFSKEGMVRQQNFDFFVDKSLQ